MKNPFQYGKIAEKDNFIDRDEDRLFLKQCLYSGVNVILVSPRRWGKSSLVKQAMTELCTENKDVKVCYIDAFPITSIADFYRIFTKEILKATSAKWQNMARITKDFLTSLTPIISFGSNPTNDISLSFEIKDDTDEGEILNLPEKIAIAKNTQVIICIDEFQHLAQLDGYERLESLMRSIWQHQQHTTYCLYGSERHMMTDIFDSSEKPFYRFGQMYHLKKIETIHWVEYIVGRFQWTGKDIAEDLAEKIVSTVDRHSWYVQQLASAVWNFTEETADNKAFEKGLIWCVDVNSESYIKICERLTETQLNLLKAIANCETKLTSADVIKKYKMGTSANIIKNKRLLERTDVIDIRHDSIEFQDPLFEIWFKDTYL